MAIWHVWGMWHTESYHQFVGNYAITSIYPLVSGISEHPPFFFGKASRPMIGENTMHTKTYYQMTHIYVLDDAELIGSLKVLPPKLQLVCIENLPGSTPV